MCYISRGALAETRNHRGEREINTVAHEGVSQIKVYFKLMLKDQIMITLNTSNQYKFVLIIINGKFVRVYYVS